MKHLIKIIVPLFIVSCSNTVSDYEKNATQEQDSHLFHSTIEQAEEARTFLDENIRLRWTADDRITLFEGTTRNKQFKFLGDTGDNAGDFEYVKAGFGTGNDVNHYYAVYPYAATNKLHEDGYITYTFPAIQNYAAGSVGLGANVMVAITADLDDYDLAFRNVGSYLLVKLYGTDQTVGSIKLTTIGGESISGKAYITPIFGGEPTTQMVDSAASVTLSCGNGVALGATKECATSFWIVVPPFTASQGIRVSVNGFYGGSQTYEVASEIVFNRNKYKTLTRELSISSNGTGMGVGGWGSDGEDHGGSAD